MEYHELSTGSDDDLWTDRSVPKRLEAARCDTERVTITRLTPPSSGAESSSISSVFNSFSIIIVCTDDSVVQKDRSTIGLLVGVCAAV